MIVKVTIIGLGQIGASIGMALAVHKDKIYRTGHDIDLNIARKAEKMGAVDKVALNLPNSVREADLVVLALPHDQIKETLGYIVEDLRENAVIVDTSPVKAKVATWMTEMLPPRRYYVGLTPVLNPAYLLDMVAGIEAARADLFQNGLFAIVAPANTVSDAIRLTTDFIQLLGAEHMFADPAEIDSLMAATHILPQLISAALVDITVDKPGWQEGRKISGRAYAEVTSPTARIDGPAELASSALANPADVTRLIDTLITALQVIRSEVQEQKMESLTERIKAVYEGRLRWWNQRLTGKWSMLELAPPAGIPSSGEWLGRLVGIRKPKSK
jgi:prephenate dehydrogenase